MKINLHYFSDGSNGWLRFFLDGRLNTMYSSGVPESGPDNTETRSDFIRKFQHCRNQIGTATPKTIFSQPQSGKLIDSGNWKVSSNNHDELVIINNEGTQQRILIKENLPGFQYEASKFTTKNFMAESTLGSAFVTGWAARGGERRLKFRVEAQKQKIFELAKELWDRHLKEEHNKPREIFVELSALAQSLNESVKKCAKNQEDTSNSQEVSELENFQGALICELRPLFLQFAFYTSTA